MKPMTERQERVVRTIMRFFDERDRPPTTRELAARLGCHIKTVYQYILALERNGFVERVDGRVHVVPALRTHRGIPIVGRVAAGRPIMAIENREALLSLADHFGKEDVFAVRVVGDSMRDAGILDGDLVIVRCGADVPSGAIAVCYLGEEQEVTVKRLRQRAGYFDLIPENEEYPRMSVPEDDPYFRVGGKVIGVVRRLS